LKGIEVGKWHDHRRNKSLRQEPNVLQLLFLYKIRYNKYNWRETMSNGRRKRGTRRSFPINKLYEKESQIRPCKNKNDAGTGAKVSALTGGGGKKKNK